FFQAFNFRLQRTDLGCLFFFFRITVVILRLERRVFCRLIFVFLGTYAARKRNNKRKSRQYYFFHSQFSLVCMHYGKNRIYIAFFRYSSPETPTLHKNATVFSLKTIAFYLCPLLKILILP